ncbi:ATP-binding cassette domain-containing protein [Salegentibacter maritimus]|uniref:ATP-binding cassette domain-containing protein n=1 Tax=Salegentibacter maritimus TaxID=2794347 RepID=UPI003743EF37
MLHGVYLKAETGKITGVLGTNGSGKSSLLKLFFGSLNSRHKLVRIDNNPYLNLD